MGEVLVQAFDYTVAARYLNSSKEMVRERYYHTKIGELGDVATEALDDIDPEFQNDAKFDSLLVGGSLRQKEVGGRVSSTQ